MDKFKINKYNDEFFVIVKSKFDEKEWDVVGKGKTELEAVSFALNMYISTEKNYVDCFESAFKEFSNSLVDDGLYLKEKFSAKIIKTVVRLDSDNPFEFSRFYQGDDGEIDPLNDYICISSVSDG